MVEAYIIFISFFILFCVFENFIIYLLFIYYLFIYYYFIILRYNLCTINHIFLKYTI